MLSKQQYFKATMLAGISTMAIITAGSAFAQETAGSGTEEIIVTAQRRSERLQDVPVAIIAQTGAKLEQAAIVSLRDMTSLAPGVSFAGSGNNTAPSIRGVFSAQSDPGNDGNVAIYMDGVYMATQLGNNVTLPDIERIEVLKGPQGTLFGRNAAGGAIRMFTVAPNMNEIKGQLTVGYASYNEFVAKGFVTGPIIEGRLAASASASHTHSDGYSYNLFLNKGNGGTESNTARLKLLFTPTDTLSFEAFGSYNYNKDNNIMSYTPLGGSTISRVLYPGVLIPTRKHTFAQERDPNLKTMQYIAGGKATLETAWGDLSNMFAWTHTHNFYDSDGDITGANFVIYPATQRHSDVQNELLFTSKRFSGLQVTLGGFYYGATGRYDPLVLQGDAFGVQLINFSRQRTDAYSGFGEANYEVNDAITIIAGLRYSSEKRHGFGGYGDVRGAEPSLGSVVFTSTTPRASIKYRFTDDGDNVYFTYSKGFKSGGYNTSGPQAAPFLPETIQAYEIGLKTTTARTISGNFSAFYYDYSNQQVSQNTGVTNITGNAATSRMWGIDGDVTAHITDEFSLGISAAFLDAKYTAFPNASIIIDTPNCLCGGANGVGNLTGFRQPYSPKFAGGVNAYYNKELAVGELNLAANLYYSGSFNWDPQGRVKNPRYATLALTASFTPTDSNLTFGVWGKNLTNATYHANVFNSPLATGVNWAAPATGGFTIKYAY